MQTSYSIAMPTSFAGDAPNGIAACLTDAYLELGIAAAACVALLLLSGGIARLRGDSNAKTVQAVHSPPASPPLKPAAPEFSDADTESTCSPRTVHSAESPLLESASDSGDEFDNDCQRWLTAGASGGQAVGCLYNSESQEDDGLAHTVADVTGWSTLGGRLSAALRLGDGDEKADSEDCKQWLAVGASFAQVLRGCPNVDDSDDELPSHRGSPPVSPFVDARPAPMLSAPELSTILLRRHQRRTIAMEGFNAKTWVDVGGRFAAALRLGESDGDTDSEAEADVDC